MSRLLGMTDKKDYLDSDDLIERKSARGIIIENNKIYLSHARINDTYKIPGGGNDLNESILDTLYSQVDFLREKQSLEIKGQINKIPNKISIISVLFIVPLILFTVFTILPSTKI